MTAQRRYVFDANALVGFLEGRSVSAQKVRRLVAEARQDHAILLISAVNWGEVFYVIWRHHGERMARTLAAEVGQLPIKIITADQMRSIRAATIKQKHRLAYADCFAAELAIDQNAALVTSDPDFEKVGKSLRLVPLPQHEEKS
jgi:predicted nucleic acid-binding protein